MPKKKQKLPLPPVAELPEGAQQWLGTPGIMADERANNPAHSREAADTAYQKRLAAERKAVIERAASSAGCCPSADQVTVLGLKNVE